MRNRFNTAFALAILLATIITPVALAAAPPLPSSFYVTVIISFRRSIGGLASNDRHMPTAGAVPREATHCSRESGC